MVDWCPYTCDKSKVQKEGYAAEALRKILEPEGYKVNFWILPFPRAIEFARLGQINGLVTSTEQESPGFVFTKRSMGVYAMSFFTRKESTWRFKGLKTIDVIDKIGIVKSYDYGEPEFMKLTKTKPEKFVTITDSNTIHRLVKMLSRKRIDAMIESEHVLKFQLKETDSAEQIRYAGTLAPPSPFYTALSPNLSISKQLRKTIDEGMDRLRKSGELAKICRDYGFDIWEDK